ncbi:tRNA-dihydrouridine synthase [Quillaja saponaria]|uniref:tRNA-dihydrouridine(16/17) synthase [NAD(P)(+)] n=1 Tax=Quillaja saponaria TaxID=32244 RepID=A0AAD7KT41_QUISA|nr:tRNA-dihydrouridine synthase [Quillaja saponaria]
MAFSPSQTQIHTLIPHSNSPEDLDDLLCSNQQQEELQKQQKCLLSAPDALSSFLDSSPSRCLTGEARFERAWAHWNKLGRPKLIVAPMVDNSELPFRMLCRKYGAEAAYTPMLHSRIFTENEKYRNEEFTTCKEDRPLFVQFCANNPDTLLEAARKVEPYCDYVDINLGCPQRIARRGNYGAFLMNNLPLIKSLVEKLAVNLNVPDAGCSLLAVHGRTRDEKDGKKFRADWNAIRAVKNALKIPVLANGNIRHMDDVQHCLEETGADGVLSAETLLENPALFSGFRTSEWVVEGEDSNMQRKLDQADILLDYLKLCERYPVPWRMIRSHVHKMLGDWFRLQPQIREDFNSQSKITFEFLYNMVDRLRDLGVGLPLYLKDTHVGISANAPSAQLHDTN